MQLPFLKYCSKIVWTALISVVLLCVVSAAMLAAEKPKSDTSVEPTSSGQVIGRVYDAQTGTPLEGAVVVVQQDGAFASEGKTVGKTSAVGAYKCEAVLGRVSSNIDVGRLLNSSIIGLLSGSATKKTQRVDITRLNLRVTCDGYHSYEGIVPCRMVSPDTFSVTMEPILLTKSSSTEVSTVAEDWGVARVVSVTVEPSILKPKSEAVVTAHVVSPPAPKSEKFAVQCLSQALGYKGLDLTPGAEGTELVFSKKLNASKKAVSDVLLVSLDTCPYDVAAGGGFGTTLVQVVNTPAEEKAAQIRLDAYNLRKEGKSAEALAKTQELCALPEATADDFADAARLADQVHDYNAAAIAWGQSVEKITDQQARLLRMIGYGEALLKNGQADWVISKIVPAIDAIKEKDRPKKVPTGLMACVGMAYIQLGQFDQADKINTALTKFPNTTLSAAAEFRRSLRLAHAEAAVKADPNSATACADLGRVLMDQGRWEEAIEQLTKSAKLDPNVPAVRWDLGYAMVHVRGDSDEAKQNFDEALAEAEKRVQGANEKEKSKDFTAWHTLSMLLYRKACTQLKAGDATAKDTLGRVRETLIEALKCGRSGKDTLSEGAYYGSFGYFGSKIVGISGFAYPEANNDFVVLESLKSLETHPDDYLAYLNLSAALVDLRQADLADDALGKCLALKPDVTEAPYIKALIAIQGGDDKEATTKLVEVLKSNPRHPHANLMLAKLYTQSGDMAAASGCLAAHAACYGNTK